MRPGAAPAALLALLLLTGCTADEQSAPDPPPDTGPAAVSFDLSSRVTRVAGRLPGADRASLAAELDEALEAYLAPALVETGSRDPSRVLQPFTAQGAKAARSRLGVLVADPWPDSAVVDTRRATAHLSVLSPQGEPAGATAAVSLVLVVTDGKDSARLRVAGRLMLTPAADGWRIFGFDLRRSGAAS